MVIDEEHSEAFHCRTCDTQLFATLDCMHPDAGEVVQCPGCGTVIDAVELERIIHDAEVLMIRELFPDKRGRGPASQTNPDAWFKQ